MIKNIPESYLNQQVNVALKGQLIPSKDDKGNVTVNHMTMIGILLKTDEDSILLRLGDAEMLLDKELIAFIAKPNVVHIASVSKLVSLK